MKLQRKTPAELRKIFLTAHREWEAVNNPKGHASGAVKKAWDKRIRALMKLARAKDV
jgi:hypothetical protein